jgi:hypothetical protein
MPAQNERIIPMNTKVSFVPVTAFPSDFFTSIVGSMLYITAGHRTP